MVDIIKRFCIAVALGLCIGILFLGTQTAKAEEKNNVLQVDEQSLIWPTVGEVSDTFGTRGGKHFGIDIAAVEGTPVVSAADGVVSKSYYSDTYGEVVFIEHENGYETVYAHLHDRFVSEGQAIEGGSQLGTVGNTGRSQGNHLHFEVHDGSWNIDKSEAIDPLFVLSEKDSDRYVALSLDSAYENDTEDAEAVYVMSNLHGMGNAGDQERHGVGQPVKMVESGDTLWSISQLYDTSIEELMEWNGLSDESIIVGDLLIVDQ
ncbi:peptidoglycan DD-metalloendopeptidase family protein [Alkalihalophilus marmarensis]|jgi:murein DD-endopeptidase MepM/ murein hydrolase activator NlpD|uniref:LysM domain-containing protein n=1 Tax=Alkalihalophilus marmarensis DSM 21297 TaxID=1188261 RepID=U6ST79_9BACI|nr:peptidoglycan DD-metalloendopeptidase family protein [Alkalihalophilus marmarensis]ERN54125.1 hypothetical protein A33I_06795 [Alkalihalophilus marmarensis DSM 21297]MCM3488452.1 peptidoglycan DD-metalloendopeptidase family protein [Alkalihalophilus marmarensis]